MNITPETQKWNDIVEYADFVTEGAYDQQSPEVLADGLQSRGFFGVARMLRLAGQPLGYFQNNPHKGVDNISANK